MLDMHQHDGVYQTFFFASSDVSFVELSNKINIAKNIRFMKYTPYSLGLKLIVENGVGCERTMAGEGQ
jgi:hypothetical protein